MSGNRAGVGCGSAAIPANARKTVQSLKEIVSNSEDEIYSVLKECNMDPNETVQRLLNEDPFHEVKRKRDKKRDWNRESTDSRLRLGTGGALMRGARGPSDRGSGRGGSLTRHPSSDFNAGRGKPCITKENSVVNSSSRMSSSLVGLSLPVAPTPGQGTASLAALSTHSLSVKTIATSPGQQNGSHVYARSTSLPQGSWNASTSAHATMADILKANNSLLSQPGAAPVVPLSSTPMGVPVATCVAQQYVIPSMSPLSPVSSGVYSSSTDPVLHPSLDPLVTVASAAIKREVGSVGNQWTKGEWSSTPITMDSLLESSITLQPLQTMQTSTTPSTVVTSLERDSQVTKPSSPQSVLPPLLQDQPVCHPVAVETGSSIGTQGRHTAGTSTSVVSRAVVACGPFGSRPAYLSQQHPVGTHKATGSSLEWKPKLVIPNVGSVGVIQSPSPSETRRPSTPLSVSSDSGIAAATSKMQGVSIHDQPVIIPNHLQVAEADQTHLSFGSFAAGFGSNHSSDFSSEEGTKKISISTDEEGSPLIKTPIDQSIIPSAVDSGPVTLNQNYVHQPISAPEELSPPSNEMTVVSMPPAVLQLEVIKPDPVVHQGPHYPYLPTMPNYPGFNMVQHVPAGQFTYESAETQPPEVTRLPSLMQSYTDPAASYYTPGFRPGSDVDVRYPSFVTNNTLNKYNGNVGLMNLTGQSTPSSQESGNSVVTPVPAVQTSQTGNGHTIIPTMAQQPLPIHAYTGQPAGAPLGHSFANIFGYQYMPPSYAYMHTHPPYQHNFTASSVYPQLPAGSSYPPIAASTYPTGGAATVKYQLPQYKPGNGTAMAPHSAATAGYGAYSSGLSGYAANSSLTTGSTACYDDVPQYKDNPYLSSQQVEGSTVWIQAQLSRDMSAGGMQTSSYYNLPGQGQHTSYAHAQPPTHAHTHPGSYANVYHPSQSGQAPASHQLLQQPQAIGAGVGSQGGGYHQPQRAQQPWTNTY